MSVFHIRIEIEESRRTEDRGYIVILLDMPLLDHSSKSTCYHVISQLSCRGPESKIGGGGEC